MLSLLVALGEWGSDGGIPSTWVEYFAGIRESGKFGQGQGMFMPRTQLSDFLIFSDYLTFFFLCGQFARQEAKMPLANYSKILVK